MTSTRATRYRQLEISGEPRAMGRQLGEAARDEIRRFVAIALDFINSIQVPRARAHRVTQESGQFAERYAPHMMEELRGVAEAAGVGLDDVLLLQVRNQLPGPVDACTSLSVIQQDGGHARHLVAQNWDSDPQLDEVTIVLTRRPKGRPASINVTQAGLIAYIGMNDAGLGVCLNTLPSPSRRVGVPHYFTVRGIYESRSLGAAVQQVRRAERAIGANILLASPEGPADLEVTIDDVCVLRDSARLTHTNHCLAPNLSRHNDEFPELIESHPRKARIDHLLHGEAGDRELIETALRDHQGYPRSICRHPNDDPRHGFWTTVFSVILDTTERRMHLARGNPCEAPYETYSLS